MRQIQTLGADVINYEDVFKESYQRALGNDSYSEDFIGYFYQVMFAKSPQVELMFANTNMSQQKTMLYDSLHILLDFYSSKQLTPYMQHLAQVHGKHHLNVPDNLYELWLESLIETVQHFDSDFNPDVELAWRLILSPGMTYIKFMN